MKVCYGHWLAPDRKTWACKPVLNTTFTFDMGVMGIVTFYFTSQNKQLGPPRLREPGKQSETRTHIGVLVFIVLVSMISFVPFLGGAPENVDDVAPSGEVGAPLEVTGVAEAVHVNAPLGLRSSPQLLQVASSSEAGHFGQRLVEVQAPRHRDGRGGAAVALLQDAEHLGEDIEHAVLMLPLQLEAPLLQLHPALLHVQVSLKSALLHLQEALLHGPLRRQGLQQEVVKRVLHPLAFPLLPQAMQGGEARPGNHVLHP